MVTLTLSTITFAGGNIQPAQVQIEVPEEVSTAKSSNFYLGLGITNLKLENDFTKESFKTKAITLQAGYTYNNYLAIEGRYTHHVGDVEYDHGSDHRVNAGENIKDYPTDFTNIALFLKPQYKINNVSLYALLGYGEVKLTNMANDGVDRAEDGFQWGLGLAYDVTEHISMYVDYLNMYDDKGFNYRATNQDIKADAFTLGITYTF
jgi:opacity protein-like surface antigen